VSSKQRREAALAAARDTVRPEPAPSGDGWPLALIARTRALWESLEGKYGFWDHGFEVFASPVPPGASLVIVGEHPVGGADAFDLARASVVPARHSYLDAAGLGPTRMREAFRSLGHEAALMGSVKTYANSFRSESLAQWRTTNVPERQYMEKLSLTSLRTTIERLGPLLVLCEGMEALQRTLKLFPGAAPTTVAVASGSRRAYCRTTVEGGMTLAAIIDAASPQTSAADWEAALPELARDLAALR
jgi:hypothetical protein